MFSVAQARDFIGQYDGYQLQGYLLENIDLIGYVASFYLVFVGKGKPILRWLCGRAGTKGKHAPYSTGALNRLFVFSCLYHIVVAAIAFACASNLFPTLLRSFEQRSGYVTLCAWDDNLIYRGPMGFWVSVCVAAKMVDLFDSVLLVFRDYMVSEMVPEVKVYVGSMRQVTAAHWWFRCSLALFWWHSFSIGISTFPTLALADAACHVVIHGANVGADLLSFVPSSITKAQGKSKPASVSILHKLLNLTSTLGLLVECIVCSAIALYSSYMNYTATEGCHVVQANVRMCLCVFIGGIVLAVAHLGSTKAAAREAAGEENGVPQKPVAAKKKQ